MPPRTSTAGRAGRPSLIVEELHPKAGDPPNIRTLVEYGEVNSPGERPKFGAGDETLADGSSYSPLVWVLTLPKVSDAQVRQWAGRGTIRSLDVWGHPGFEIRGASIEDSLRPFDYGAAIVQMPDATVVITQPPHAADNAQLVLEAASHLVKRQ